MFEKFMEYVGEKKICSFSSAEEFIALKNGNNFMNGMYRLFKTNDVSKWNEIVETAFPQYAHLIEVFGFDWLGRIFALNKKSGTVLVFEPGTGEVLDIPADLTGFHDIEIAEYHEDSLASNFFEEWFEKSGRYVLKYNECAGYKVPLFLNGDDTVDNLEVGDMEVYWEIMTPLINV